MRKLTGPPPLPPPPAAPVLHPPTAARSRSGTNEAHNGGPVVITTRCTDCGGIGFVHTLASLTAAAAALTAATATSSPSSSDAGGVTIPSNCLATTAATVSHPQEIIRSFQPCPACVKCSHCENGRRVVKDIPGSSPLRPSPMIAAASARHLAHNRSRSNSSQHDPEDQRSPLSSPKKSPSSSPLSPIGHDSVAISATSLASEAESIAKRAGKASRKRRSDATSAIISPSVAAAAIAGVSSPVSGIDTNPAAYATPAIVAAVSMSRVRSISADTAASAAARASRMPISRSNPTIAEAAGDEEGDGAAEPTAVIDNGDGTLTTAASARRAAVVRKRVSMMTAEDMEIDGIVLRGPPPPSSQPNRGGERPLSGSGASGSFGDLRASRRSPMSTSLGDLPKVAAADQGGLGAGGLRMSKSQSLSVSTPSLAGERRMDGSAGSLHRLQQSPDLFGLAGAKRRSGGSSGGIADGSGPDVPMLSAMLATDGATLAVAGASGEGGNAGSADFQDRRASGLSETGGPWHMSDSASIASTDVAVGVNRQPSPTGQGVVGVVGSRKVKKPPSVSHISTAPPSDSPEPKDKKDSAKLSNLSDLREENIFPEEIHLRTIFSVKDKAQSTLEQMIWAARCYEIAKTVWQLSPPPEKPPYEHVPNDEIKYRILEKFSDGPLPTVKYRTREAGSKLVTAGPSEALVDALIFPLNQDDSYASVFLSTYRFFMPASEVLTSLIEWYNVEADEDATPQQEAFLKRHRRLFRVRSIRCILLWIKHHWYDFHNDPQLLEELVNFVADVSETSFGDGQKMTQAIRESRLSWYMTQYIPPFSNRRAAPSEAFKPWALRWEAEAFAEQLTLIDSHLFRQIRPDAYLHLLQMPLQAADLRESAAFKAIMDYVSWFRLVSAYCATLIVKEDNVKKRTKAIRRFIKIAKICRELNNYNTLFAVMHGLKRPAVHKLSPAWEAVPAKYLETFRSMEELMNPEDGYAAYWTALKATKPPAIPFFAAYMHDLIEIHEDDPVYVADLPPDDEALFHSPTSSSQYTSTPSPTTPTSRTSSPQRDRDRWARNGRPSPAPSGETGDNSASGADDDSDNEDGEDSSASMSSTNRDVNFLKFHEIHTVLQEIEEWRACSYREMLPEASASAADAKIDTAAVVLNHMRDYELVDDAALDGGADFVEVGGKDAESAVSAGASGFGARGMMRFSSFLGGRRGD